MCSCSIKCPRYFATTSVGVQVIYKLLTKIGWMFCRSLRRVNIFASVFEAPSASFHLYQLVIWLMQTLKWVRRVCHSKRFFLKYKEKGKKKKKTPTEQRKYILFLFDNGKCLVLHLRKDRIGKDNWNNYEYFSKKGGSLHGILTRKFRTLTSPLFFISSVKFTIKHHHQPQFLSTMSMLKLSLMDTYSCLNLFSNNFLQCTYR